MDCLGVKTNISNTQFVSFEFVTNYNVFEHKNGINSASIAIYIWHAE